MTLARALDERGMRYQRQGRLGFYLPASGEEGLAVGSAYPLRKDDWLFPSYRIVGAALWRGAALDQLVANCYGNADDHGHVTIKDVTAIEWIAWTPMLVLILALGVYPQMLFKILDPAVTRLVVHLGEHLTP